MSNEAQTYVKLLDLGDNESPAIRLLLHIIAENTFNDSFRCKLGQEQLAWESGRISDRSLRRYLAALEDAEIVKRYARYNQDKGRQTDAIEICGFESWYHEQRGRFSTGRSLPDKLSGKGGLPDKLSGRSSGHHESAPTGQQVSGIYKEDLTSPYSPPYPPEGGGDSADMSDDEASQDEAIAETPAAALADPADAPAQPSGLLATDAAALDTVNEVDQPNVEHLLTLGRHRLAILRLIVPVLAKVRLSATDKAAALALIAAEAEGLGEEALRKAAEMVIAGAKTRDRVKADRFREAIAAVKAGGACAVITKGSAEWDAWAAHDKALGRRLEWWNRYATWQVPSLVPPPLPAATQPRRAAA